MSHTKEIHKLQDALKLLVVEPYSKANAEAINLVREVVSELGKPEAIVKIDDIAPKKGRGRKGGKGKPRSRKPRSITGVAPEPIPEGEPKVGKPRGRKPRAQSPDTI